MLVMLEFQIHKYYVFELGTVSNCSHAFFHITIEVPMAPDNFFNNGNCVPLEMSTGAQRFVDATGS
jgi:hypothetical protein